MVCWPICTWQHVAGALPAKGIRKLAWEDVGNFITSEARLSPDSTEVVAFESRLPMR
jgi:hypothetical protein